MRSGRIIGPAELIAVVIHDEERPRDGLKTNSQSREEDVILLVKAAILKKDIYGKASLRETEDVYPGKGAVFGAIAGSLIDLPGGPLSVVVRTTACAAAGSQVAGKINLGFPDETLKEL